MRKGRITIFVLSVGGLMTCIRGIILIVRVGVIIGVLISIENSGRIEHSQIISMS